MSDFDDESRQEYAQAMADYGFDEMDHEEGLEEAIDELLDDIERLPDKLQQVFEYLLQGHDLADAAHYAGYGTGVVGLHKVLRKDTGHGLADKLRHAKDAHGAGRTKAHDSMSARSGS